MNSSLPRRLFDSLASVQVRRPWWPILVCALFTVIGGFMATRLELRTRFDQLLPEHQPSVVELQRVLKRTSSNTNAFVVLEGDDTATLRAFGDALVPRLNAVGRPWVESAEDGVQDARAFLLPRAGFFMSLPELQKLHDDVEARWQWEVGNATGSNLDDDEPPPLTAESMKKRLTAGHEGATDKFPDGYYQSADGKAIVVIAHTGIAAGDLDRSAEALGRIRKAVDEVHATPSFASVRAGYAGDLVTGLAEYGAVKEDLMSVGILGVGLVLGIVLLYFMRLRALVAMGITIGAGLAWTFGLTRLAIGHLNVATGFLVSIVAGNGINFGILYMSRYFEERRKGATPEMAVRTAHHETWPSTATAAAAAAASYGSLGVTDFLAFKHFAFIGAVGMVVCWIATYTMLPAVLVVLERVSPFGSSEKTWFARIRQNGLRYETPFAALALKAPRVLASIGGAAAIVGLAVIVPYMRSDPMEYNMRHLQNDLGTGAEMYRVSSLAANVLGAELESAMIVLAERTDQVPLLKKTLEARRDAAPPDQKPFEAVHTLFDFVPPDQAEKAPLIEEVRDRLVRARARGSITDGDWAEMQKYLPPEDVHPFGFDDLPEGLVRPFREKDGTRGRIVVIEPTAGKNDSDLRYLLRWADSFRETTLPNGDVVRGSGRAVIFADMLKAVLGDMPRAVALSLGMTVLAVLLMFRRGRHSAAVLFALAVGLAWMGGYMWLARTKINFFNFIALPITFGIGVDYAVNFMQRYVAESESGGAEGEPRPTVTEAVFRALKGTGGAVILCSLTTILGYIALLGSINQAIRSLGALAVIGEVCCLVAAILVLPAVLVWRDRRARTRSVVTARAAAEAAPPSLSGS